MSPEEKKGKKKQIEPRVSMREQDSRARKENFNEVALGYGDKEAVQEASRCLQCKKMPCVEGCPVEIDIPAFIKLVEEGDFLGELLRYSRELSEDLGFEELAKKELSSLFEDTRAGRFIDYPNRQELRDLLRKAEEICWENLHGEEDE